MEDVPDEVVAALAAREPLFHREPAGSDRDHFAAMTAPDFDEVGASGTRYDRDDVLDIVAERYRSGEVTVPEVSGLRCRRLGDGTYLVTYLLDQQGRITRRATIWEYVAEDGWRVVYHQGTLTG